MGKIFFNKGIYLRLFSYVFLSGVFLFALPLFQGPSALGASPWENYGFYCAQCHGPEGKGDGPNAVESQPADPRDHTSAHDMRKLTDEDIVTAIRDGGGATGKSTLMPPFGKTLTGVEIIELKDLLRRLCGCEGA
ncbi:MAG: hypothetical protein BMS9Abin23_0341 [Thermodesulfobacteriota bacterium]|nr:MAG: hypothetical protein BMS9Abin23_0341 [Thermodesulfobacteriota bacterium]